MCARPCVIMRVCSFSLDFEGQNNTTPTYHFPTITCMHSFVCLIIRAYVCVYVCMGVRACVCERACVCVRVR